MGAWRDENSNRLVGLAMWESQEAYEASAERIFQVVADDPWDQWCERPIDVFRLTALTGPVPTPPTGNLTVGDFTSLIVFASLSVLSASDLSQFQGQK